MGWRGAACASAPQASARFAAMPGRRHFRGAAIWQPALHAMAQPAPCDRRRRWRHRCHSRPRSRRCGALGCARHRHGRLFRSRGVLCAGHRLEGRCRRRRFRRGRRRWQCDDGVGRHRCRRRRVLRRRDTIRQRGVLHRPGVPGQPEGDGDDQHSDHDGKPAPPPVRHAARRRCCRVVSRHFGHGNRGIGFGVCNRQNKMHGSSGRRRAHQAQVGAGGHCRRFIGWPMQSNAAGMAELRAHAVGHMAGRAQPAQQAGTAGTAEIGIRQVRVVAMQANKCDHAPPSRLQPGSPHATLRSFSDTMARSPLSKDSTFEDKSKPRGGQGPARPRVGGVARDDPARNESCVFSATRQPARAPPRARPSPETLS
jgi:hypothetical protein